MRGEVDSEGYAGPSLLGMDRIAAGLGILRSSALTPFSHFIVASGRDAQNTRTPSLDPSTREPGRRPSDRVARSVDTCSNLRQLYAVDHSARASMKSAASCVN